MHRRWRRSVASWRLYFSGRRLTMTIGDRDCTVVCPRLLTVGDSVVLFDFLVFFKFCTVPLQCLSDSVTLISTLLLTYLLTYRNASCVSDSCASCIITRWRWNGVAVSRRENWSSLVSGGECIVKQYVYFTHVCSVSNYLPNVDYCCCVHDDSLLCCRYHQGWNHFRCVESDDLVDTLYVCLPTFRFKAK